MTIKLPHPKGLSHEIDFDNVDENWQMLALISAAAGFEFFGRTSYLFVPENAKIMLIAAVFQLILQLYSRQACHTNAVPTLFN